MKPKYEKPSKALVFIGCLCPFVIWTTSLFFVIVVFFCGFTKIEPSEHVSTIIFLSWIIALFLGGIGYMVLTLMLRCPYCNYRFLKNDKSGLEPTAFVYSPSCPRIPGFKPWFYQIGRFLWTRRFTCLNCGEEIFS